MNSGRTVSDGFEDYHSPQPEYLPARIRMNTKGIDSSPRDSYDPKEPIVGGTALADEKHIKRLKRGVEAWNTWR
jgi:hypothetical protein